MAPKPEIILRGHGVSPGVVWGRALKIDSHNRVIPKVEVADPEAEIARFLAAVELSKIQLQGLKGRLEEKVGVEHGVILDAHFLILDDRVLHEEIIAAIRGERANAEWAVTEATDRLIAAYESLEDEYFRERHSDIEHVAERMLVNLSGDRSFSLERLPEDVILVARDFNPSNFATMDLGRVRGLVLESGGRTSHTAILSRGLRLPAVMGLRDVLSSVATGDLLLVNGDGGQVIVHPAPGHLENARHQKEALAAAAESPGPEGTAAATADGVALSLRANTELPHELTAAVACGAEGIGLYRSEFLYFAHPNGFPCMEEQRSVYATLALAMSPHPVAIRTLDAGAERLPEGEERLTNPSMGLRGIRLSLEHRDVFREQVEAILRAAGEGNIEMVLPMVSTVEEIWQARDLVARVRAELEDSGFSPVPVPLGVMIEVPAAVLVLENLAREADFLCVGTNDLIQYVMAADRGNPAVAYLCQPLHPSVLSCLGRIAEVAGRMRKPVRICGEISSNPFFAVLLVGMGFRQLSMTPLAIPAIRRALGEVPLEDARRVAERALTLATAAQVYEYLVPEVSHLIPTDLSTYEKEIRPTNGRHE